MRVYSFFFGIIILALGICSVIIFYPTYNQLSLDPRVASSPQSMQAFVIILVFTAASIIEVVLGAGITIYGATQTKVETKPNVQTTLIDEKSLSRSSSKKEWGLLPMVIGLILVPMGILFLRSRFTFEGSLLTGFGIILELCALYFFSFIK